MYDNANSITIKPNKTAIIYTLIVGLFIACLYAIIWIREINAGPLVAWTFRVVLSYLLFEIIVMLTKPLGISYEGNILDAKYLSYQYRFSLDDVSGYSTLHYTTRYGIKNSIVLYLKSGKTVEVNEVMMDSIAPVQQLVEEKGVPFYGTERSYFFTSYPFRKYHNKSSVG